MVKRPYANGFTLIEMLFVLLIGSIIVLLITKVSNYQSILLRYDMEIMKEKIIETQADAVIHNEKSFVRIQPTYMQYNNQVMYFHSDVICTPYTFHFNEKGSISNAGSFTCSAKNTSMKMIMQLGTGRIRIE